MKGLDRVAEDQREEVQMFMAVTEAPVETLPWPLVNGDSQCVAK